MPGGGMPPPRLRSPERSAHRRALRRALFHLQGTETLMAPNKRVFLLPAALASALLLSACGGSPEGSGGPAGDGAAPSAEFNSADVMFAQMMIPHHEQARSGRASCRETVYMTLVGGVLLERVARIMMQTPTAKRIILF